VSDDIHYRVLKALEGNPNATQRELSRSLGISLGKANYCMQALIAKGWVKVKNFRNSRNKTAYAYLLTPRGVEYKANLAARFLRRKSEEFEALKHEIEQLRCEVKSFDQKD
jgi:EPS-associated MarR family transcriptional regulator